MYIGLQVILVSFKWHLDFLDRFPKYTQISIFMIIRPGETKLFRADGQTHMMKLTALFVIVRLRQKIQRYTVTNVSQHSNTPDDGGITLLRNVNKALHPGRL